MTIDNIYDAFEWSERLKKVERMSKHNRIHFKTIRAILIAFSLCSALLLVVTMLNTIMDSLSISRYPMSYEIVFIIIPCILGGAASMMFPVEER